MKYAKILSTPKFRAQKNPRCAGSLEKMMELFKELNLWLAVAQFIVLGWLIYGSRRDFIAKEAADDKKPLLSGEDWAVMRPGDTALVMLKMDGMTMDQQQRMMKGIIQIMQRARERGIEVIALPVRKGDQAVVVSRSAQEKGSDGGQSTNDSASQRDPAGGQVAAHPKT